MADVFTFSEQAARSLIDEVRSLKAQLLRFSEDSSVGVHDDTPMLAYSNSEIPAATTSAAGVIAGELVDVILMGFSGDNLAGQPPTKLKVLNIGTAVPASTPSQINPVVVHRHVSGQLFINPGVGGDCQSIAAFHGVPNDACAIGRTYALTASINETTGMYVCGNYEVFKCGDPLLDILEQADVVILPPTGGLPGEVPQVEVLTADTANVDDVFISADPLKRCNRVTAKPGAQIRYRTWFASDEPGTTRTDPIIFYP